MPSEQNDDLTLEFLDRLYRDVETGWVNLFSIDRTTGKRHVDWAEISDLDELAAVAADRATSCCVWFGVATRRERLPDGQRGGSEHCVEIPALWVDIDVAGPNHADNEALPADFKAALRILHAFPVAPSVTVDSGGGIQAWWFLDEPADAATIGPTLARWHATWDRLAGDLHIDNVFDVARIMRLPGTFNRKNEPRPVTIIEANWTLTRGLSDIEDLLDLVHAPTGVTVARPTYVGPQRPGDAYNVAHRGGEVLASLGFELSSRERNGDEHWTRPGKNVRDGGSATVYGDDGHITVWSSTVAAQYPHLQINRPYDPFGLTVVTRFAGDFAAATSTLRANGYGHKGAIDVSWAESGESVAPLDAVTHGWEPVDLATVLADGYEPPTPTVLLRSDDTALFYPGRVNSLLGESGCGKSWAAQLATVQVLQAGGHVIYIDLEDHAGTLTRRLLDLGVSREALIERFVYIHPEIAYNAAAAAEIEAYVSTHSADLVVIDSVGEAMALQGAKQNDDEAVAHWNRLLPRRLASFGPAVILIDHVPKAKDAPSGYAIGSQRKRAAIDGAAFRVEQVKAFGRGRAGIAKLTCTKDRNGIHPNGHVAGELHLNAVGGLVATLKAVGGGSEEFRPTVLMERVSQYLENGPARTQRNIREYVTGKTEHIATALEILIAEGHVRTHSQGTATYHFSARPYRQTDEIVPVEDTEMEDVEGF